jgi:outer membrane protein TolC
MLPNDQTKRETIKAYIQEAVVEHQNIQLAELRLKNVFNSIKESEEALEITLAEFKEGLKAALDYDKVQVEIDKRQAGIDLVDNLQI